MDWINVILAVVFFATVCVLIYTCVVLPRTLIQSIANRSRGRFCYGVQESARRRQQIADGRLSYENGLERSK